MFLPHNHLVGENWSLADGQLWGLLLAWHTRAGLPFPWLLRAGSKPQMCFPTSLVGLLQLLHLLQLPSTSTWVQLEDMAAICVGCSGYNWPLAPKTSAQTHLLPSFAPSYHPCFFSAALPGTNKASLSPANPHDGHLAPFPCAFPGLERWKRSPG